MGLTRFGGYSLSARAPGYTACMRLPKRVLLWLMGIFYVVGGVNHFANTDFYMPMMAPYLPLHMELVYLSGVAEIVLGVAVLIPGLQRPAAWAIILLLIAVFPANLHIALHNVPIGGRAEGLGVWNWVRLPLQAVLIAWAWWYTRPEHSAAASRRALAA
jgi:uncharacterized membrane protein